MELLKDITMPTGGHIILHNEVNEQFESDLRHILTQREGMNATLEVICSNGIQVRKKKKMQKIE